MKFTKSMKTASALGTATIVVGSAGVAVALWSATGSGDGSAKAYTAKNVPATAVVSPTEAAGLWPGNATGTSVNFTLDNSNPYPVKFTGWSGATVADPAG